MSATRSRVLTCFKKLHRARCQVFNGDSLALTTGREKINAEFRKNKNITDISSIEELIKSGEDVAQYLKSSVVQARLNENTGRYEVQLTRDSALQDNAKYLGGDNKTKTTCCSET